MKNSNAIFISTNNYKSIDELFDHLNDKVDGFDVIFVDTHSNDENYVNKIKKLCENKKYIHVISKKANYDFSSPETAYNEFLNYEKFWFQQDSLYPKSKNTYIKIFDNIKKGNPCSWLGFEKNLYPFNNPVAIEFVTKYFYSTDYEVAIFGPNFGISKEDLILLFSNIDPNIKLEHKTHQATMEAGWAILFKKYKLIQNNIEGMINFDKIHQNKYELFEKKFWHRE